MKYIIIFAVALLFSSTAYAKPSPSSKAKTRVVPTKKGTSEARKRKRTNPTYPVYRDDED